MRPAGTAIRFDDVTLGYGRRPAVHHLAGTIAPGSLTAIVGPNGAGKSTLLKGVVGTLAPLQGAISLSEGMRTRIAYLPQQSELDRSFPARVVDLVSMGLWPKRGLLGRYTVEDKASVTRALSVKLSVMALALLARAKAAGVSPVARLKMRWKWKGE